MAEPNEFSRLRNATKVFYSGNVTYGYWKKYPWLAEKPEQQYIQRYKVQNAQEGRPDLIAGLVYDNPQLDWVLIAYNAIIVGDLEAQSALNWPKAGKIIEYPSNRIVTPSLLASTLT